MKICVNLNLLKKITRGGNKMIGKKIWTISDGFMSSTENGGYVSHEAVCVLNATQSVANIEITVFFEDREPLKGLYVKCDSMRTNHIRLDKISNKKGETIPKDKPYALLVESDVEIVVQHSRMDVSQAEMTLMTTMAY